MAERAFPSSVLALGATSAIADATLRLLAERGTRFCLVGRNADRLNAVAADLHTRGATGVATIVMDLDNTQAHPAMLAAAVQTMGTIDLALLAHGILGDQGESEASYSAAEAVLRTNFLSAVSLITLLANYFEPLGQGTIAVVSSVAGDRGRKSNYIYGASKGGLNIFLDGVRSRLDRAGVQVLTIKPGFVATPMTAHLRQGTLFAQPWEVARGIVKAIEKRRDVVYLPPFWAPIMLILRLMPRPIFKKLNI
jgi:short-subunit dehydrogenase